MTRSRQESATRSKGGPAGPGAAPRQPPSRWPESTANACAITRHRLLDRLSAEPRPRLIVVQGPAGYGKTSLLRQHCERRAARGERITWVRMDAESADAPHFLRLLCEAVESPLPTNAHLARKAVLQRATTLQDLLRRLARIREPASKRALQGRISALLIRLCSRTRKGRASRK